MNSTETGASVVSVIVPCFNGGKTIKQTIASVKAQTWPSIEIIIVDDGSNDTFTLDILSSLEGVKVLRQENSGLSSARNAGFAIANGSYFLPLDADDWMEPETVETMISTIRSLDTPNFVYCDVRLQGQKSGIRRRTYNFFEQLSSNQIPYFIMIPKSIFVGVGGYDETMNDGYEDWEFNIRLGSNGYFGRRIPKELFNYTVSSNGMLLSKSKKLHGKLWMEIQKRNKEVYTISQFVRIWLDWKDCEISRHPIIYFFHFLLFKFSPVFIFNFIYRNFK